MRSESGVTEVASGQARHGRRTLSPNLRLPRLQLLRLRLPRLRGDAAVLRVVSAIAVGAVAFVIAGWSPGVIGVLAGVLSWLLLAARARPCAAAIELTLIIGARWALAGHLLGTCWALRHPDYSDRRFPVREVRPGLPRRGLLTEQLIRFSGSPCGRLASRWLLAGEHSVQLLSRGLLTELPRRGLLSRRLPQSQAAASWC
jgi:hypothetical protein